MGRVFRLRFGHSPDSALKADTCRLGLLTGCSLACFSRSVRFDQRFDGDPSRPQGLEPDAGDRRCHGLVSASTGTFILNIPEIVYGLHGNSRYLALLGGAIFYGVVFHCQGGRGSSDQIKHAHAVCGDLQHDRKPVNTLAMVPRLPGSGVLSETAPGSNLTPNRIKQ